jgi:cupin fold WbuC family metalloprotein
MQPHLHPGDEKIEKIHIVYGKVVIYFFDDLGKFIKSIPLEKGGVEFVEVPAFTWHTYIIQSDYAITYETMMGVYRPDTWKKLAEWAPQEGTPECDLYLNYLKQGIEIANRA